MQDENPLLESPTVFIHRLHPPSYYGYPFNLTEAQRCIITWINSHPKVIISKERQVGMSMILAGYSLFCALKHPPYQVLVMCHNPRNAEKMFKVIVSFCNKYLLELKGTRSSPLISWDFKKCSLKTQNGSSIRVASQNLYPDMMIGKTYNMVVIDEGAFFDEPLWEVDVPKVVLASSFDEGSQYPTGQAFEGLYEQSCLGFTEWFPAFLPRGFR